MSDPQNPTPPTPPAPEAAKPETVDLAALKAELAEVKKAAEGLQSLRGKWSQEVGYLRDRNKELEALTFGNQGQPPAPPPDPSWPSQAPAYVTQPPLGNIVSREEFDLYRAQSAIGSPETFDKVRKIAMDNAQVSKFLRFSPNPSTGLLDVDQYGRPKPSVFDTYMAIKENLDREAEKAELEALKKASAPAHNPALAAISGGGASNTTEASPDLMAFLNDPNTTPEMIKEKFPGLVMGPLYSPPDKG